MTNKQIAKAFSQLADLMELHQENPFKIKSYANAYVTLRKIDISLAEMSIDELATIKGIGKSTAEKIKQYVTDGTIADLERYKNMTPPGVVEMLQLQGFGPKKVYQIWKDLEIESIGELWYACNENRLIELKGFGLKTQDELKKKIEFFQKGRHKKLFADIEDIAEHTLQALRSRLPNIRTELTGAMRRLHHTIERVEYLVASLDSIASIFDDEFLTLEKQDNNHYLAHSITEELPIAIYTCAPDEFGSKQFRYTASKGFMEQFLKANEGIDFRQISEENDVFAKAKWPYIVPELREGIHNDFAALADLPLIVPSDIKGIVHTHTNYSDGLHSLTEMCKHAQELGYQYIVISDHSQSAFYANGLKPERVIEQWKEIDQLNQTFTDFKIFKSIESDILYDGNLDYREEILQGFDLVIASVHSHLKMDETKATARLLKAIESPYTTILGHMTGRLLLSREGYPIDHRKIIDACAANQVAIELNANPWRLDMDWTWIPYAIERGVMISINPDAHAREGIRDIRYGVLTARKGALTAQNCLNALSTTDFYDFCQKRK